MATSNGHLLICLPPIPFSWELLFPPPCGSGGAVHQGCCLTTMVEPSVNQKNLIFLDTVIGPYWAYDPTGPTRVLLGTWKVHWEGEFPFQRPWTVFILGSWTSQGSVFPPYKKNLPENEGNKTERWRDAVRVLMTSDEGLHSSSTEPINSPFL